MTKNEVLKKYFGYDAFRAGQREIIDGLLHGRDTVCIMPTGGGKSVCYQIPAVMLDGTTIVISPLIALMKDQVNSLQMHGISAAYLNSTLEGEEYFNVLDDFKNGRYKILYVAPERLNNPKFLSICQNCKIPLVVVDEAHCISQWGQCFRPDYIKIYQFICALADRPTVGAFTATATPKVKDDIINRLKLKTPLVSVNGFDRPNLYFDVIHSKSKNRDLLKVLATRKEQSGIVYCATRKLVEKVTDLLNKEGYSAAMYHAGLDNDIRRKSQEDFVYDRVKIIVATNAFGMGIDKSNISFVIHYNMPRSVESYYQEAGRAGRDGRKADCILLYSYNDYSLNEYLISVSEQNDAVDIQQYKENEYEKLKTMNNYCLTDKCLRAYILNYFDERSPYFCGNCGNCTGVEKTDVTYEARVLLSCIIKTNNSFGVSMIINIVRGSKGKKLRSMRLDKQSTYGLLADRSEDFLRAVIESLIVEDVLTVNENAVVSANDRETIMSIFREQTRWEINYRKKRAPSKNVEKEADYGSELFEALKRLRTELANELRVPAYIVFSDATLAEMCEKRPKNKSELLEISGVGLKKLENFGDKFLEIIANFSEEND